MKARCKAKTGKHYKNYSSRGITVCDEWVNDYPAFKKWALENGYEEGLSIDRIDNNLGYSPDNCRWVPKEEQWFNKRNSSKFTFNGETKTAAEWAKQYGMEYSIFYNRAKNGWDLEKIVNTPIDERFSHPSAEYARRHMK